MSTEAERASGAPAGVETVALDDFAALLQKQFKPSNDERKSRIEESVRTLAEMALSDAKIIGDDVFASVDAMRAAIDRKLSAQMDAILHHPDFQQLESAWRGLHYLVMGTPTSATLKIKVLNVSKEECRKMFRQFRDAAWDQSPLFKKVYEAEFGQLGGEPFGSFVCDYYFDQSAPDIDVMKGLAKIGGAAHAPFVASAAPSLIGMESWTELSDPRDLGEKFNNTEYAAWKAFRDTDDSKYLSLALPRFLGRDVYGANSNPVEGFAFEEQTGGDHDKYLWVNAAYAMGTRITESFADYGWCTRIRGVESGGTVHDLPTPTFRTDDGGVDMKCPTEIAISDRREKELADNGLMPLVHRKNTNQATFIGAQTVNRPKGFIDSDATANANIAARLPYVFASCRFAHYLKCMVRDWVGGTRTQAQLERDLSDWVMQYVDGSPENSTEATKARLPLKGASIAIEPDPENPGYYRGKFSFMPHYQLEGMDIALSMVSRLPKGQGS